MSRFTPQDLFERLARSRFRSRFHLDDQARLYLENRGLDAVMDHGATFVAERLAPAHPQRDGKQTPMRGHPVFIAQHATGTCCRSCLSKWHGMEPGKPLTTEQQEQILRTLRSWIERDFGQAVPGNPAQGVLL
ncbi:DUF4186 domain-containing protein [Gluconobacter albidus]|uniref:Cytoplasmic protein n=1 Tax=Gluconobacter albidus TaxID=318683 RepID=A0AAW3QVH2_9PROT|nr:DUF4186 domain-containing protein [Gluconobacter albidus]KXV37444.1 cytoplasmic protein [Gluconobacter albidus]MBS1026867.1 DUF4186 domain-containing protein [Gluconobacter albidus]GLQ70343.1 DUF4186 domain-containing protein [Gluconobacter albidus]